MSEPIEPPVVFNMDLANGPTAERFCREAAAVLGIEWTAEYDDEASSDDSEHQDWAVDHWNEVLENAGYYVWWNASDVVVYDLSDLSEDDREQFYSESEDW